MWRLRFRLRLLPVDRRLRNLRGNPFISHSHIYIGPPSKSYRAIYGAAPRIQLNEYFAEPEAIREFVISERESMYEKDKPLMKMSLKIVQNVQMGIVTDVKQELRKAKALNIVYSATKDKSKE